MFVAFVEKYSNSPAIFSQISRSCVQSFVCVSSLSSPLLLRISPNTFAFIPISLMSLSSRNRSNSKAFCHILPRIALVCEDMHYHKTGVPWQIKSIFIIILFHLVFLNNFTIPINDSINTTATNGIPASVTANIIYSIPFSRCSHPPVACDTIHI